MDIDLRHTIDFVNSAQHQLSQRILVLDFHYDNDIRFLPTAVDGRDLRDVGENLDYIARPSWEDID
ncbi:MAG: hypothetical protein JW394_0545 [Nitrospira sp.]|nr:hypothetical protein [Nitrospira sp.]